MEDLEAHPAPESVGVGKAQLTWKYSEMEGIGVDRDAFVRVCAGTNWSWDGFMTQCRVQKFVSYPYTEQIEFESYGFQANSVFGGRQKYGPHSMVRLNNPP